MMTKDRGKGMSTNNMVLPTRGKLNEGLLFPPVSIQEIHDVMQWSHHISN